MNKFAYRLRDLRREFNISGKILSQRLEVTEANISQWENGRNYPNEKILEKLADYFDVSLDYLMGRSDIKRPERNNFQFAFSDYDKLTDDQKEIIKNLAASLVAQNEAKKK